jgi:hypothetical protein
MAGEKGRRQPGSIMMAFGGKIFTNFLLSISSVMVLTPYALRFTPHGFQV